MELKVLGAIFVSVGDSYLASVQLQACKFIINYIPAILFLSFVYLRIVFLKVFAEVVD